MKGFGQNGQYYAQALRASDKEGEHTHVEEPSPDQLSDTSQAQFVEAHSTTQSNWEKNWEEGSQGEETF